MKKIITIITLLALSISCLTSCGARTPIRRSSVGPEWKAMVNGDHKVVALGSSLDQVLGMYLNYNEPEMIDNVISVLKTFEPHIEKEIKDYDSSSADNGLWALGGLILYMSTGKGDTEKARFASSNGDIEVEYNYEIYINFKDDKCQISVIDHISNRGSSAFFKCDVDTSEYRKSLNAIFEQETDA